VTNATDLQGRYRLKEAIASGGMGRVYAATDARLGRRVAVKLLRDDLRNDPDFVERFRREAMAAAALAHPNIATIFDYGEDGDRRFIIMELVPGRDLGAVLAVDAPMESARAAAITGQVADALAYAHDAGIVHRDIKPGNVMVQDGDRVKVTDFGIARAAGDASLTAAGSILGTVHYMSPEQARGDAVGPASDIYSLGVVLYEMLVGAVPFTSDFSVSVALRHVSDDIPVPSTINAEVSPHLDAIVARATAKDPSDRFPTAAAMSAALRNPSQPAPDTSAITRPLNTAPATQTETAAGTWVLEPIGSAEARWSRRGIWILGAAVALLLLLGALVMATRHGPDARPRGGARAQGQNHPAARATIPPVNGLTVTQAAAALTADHLVREQHTVVNDAPAGTALYTDPAAGEVVKNGARVALYVSSGPPAPRKEPHQRHDKPKKDKPPKDKKLKHHHPKEKHH
jgi:eukaryotic-like serine/threonine-protein kinase